MSNSLRRSLSGLTSALPHRAQPILACASDKAYEAVPGGHPPHRCSGRFLRRLLHSIFPDSVEACFGCLGRQLRNPYFSLPQESSLRSLACQRTESVEFRLLSTKMERGKEPESRRVLSSSLRHPKTFPRVPPLCDSPHGSWNSNVWQDDFKGRRVKAGNDLRNPKTVKQDRGPIASAVARAAKKPKKKK